MKKFFDAYPLVAFIILFPASLLMWRYILGDWGRVATVSLLPVLVAYIIPAAGTNLTKLWEFNAKGKLGNFPWYHGFVLGASINIFGGMAYVISPDYRGLGQSFVFAVIMGSFVAFWNWYYDIYAIKAGFITVYNKAHAEGKSAEEITVLYAPIYFFTLGFIYGLYLKIAQLHFSAPVQRWIWLAIAFHILALCLPTAVFTLASKKIDGNWGVSRYKP